MLTRPGSGYLSTGLQQVVDRPFGLSEWVHVYPSLYSAEGPALVAAYGLGLQGWDSSYEFQSTSGGPGFSNIVGNFPWGVWNADVPTQVGQYPALARMIFRGDVEQGDVISTRVVSDQDLATGTFSFSDRVRQQGDIKTFGGTVPAEALAAGRVVVKFTAAPEPSTFPDLAKYRAGTALVSNTGQLAWDTRGRGFFTVNTPGTRALVGFAEGQEVTLGDVKIKLQCPYASVFLTALDKGAALATTRGALLSVVARNCNTGCKVFTVSNKVMDNGAGPVLLEPVKATVAISGRPVAAVNILDHDGRPTGRSLPITEGSFSVDGARDRALYYEVVF